MDCLETVKPKELMERTEGPPEIRIGLIVGSVLTRHPELASGSSQEVPSKVPGTCVSGSSYSCGHSTLVAGVLAAKRGGVASAIYPGCTLLVRPIFSESRNSSADPVPSANAVELSAALVACINAGARIVNLSLGRALFCSGSERNLEEAR
jgi:subtilisin family serine protease